MEKFYRLIQNMCGEEGKHWLAQLPKIVDTLMCTWNLKELRPVKNLSYNYVLKGFTTTNNSIVVKICINERMWKNETTTLEYFNGNGCVQLLAKDASHKAMLLEAAEPGRSLKTFFPKKDAAATVIAANIIKKLHTQTVTKPSSLPTLEQWVQALYNPQLTQTLPQNHVTTAQKIASELLATQTQKIILHADLHHENILTAMRQPWLAIDPHGVVGEAAYEPGSFIRNPMTSELNKKIIAYRLDAFADMLNIERARISSWAYVQSILSVCWSIEDNTKHSSDLTLTQTLRSFL